MATPKIYCVTNTSTNAKSLIRAFKAADAAAVFLRGYKAELASIDTVYALARSGVELHEGSLAPGSKGAKFVTVASVSTPDTVVLLRAKSLTDAITRVAGSNLKVEMADQETLVALLPSGVTNAPGIRDVANDLAPANQTTAAAASAL